MALPKTRPHVKIGEREFRKAEARGARMRAAGMLARSAHYDAPSRRILLEMTNGVLMGIPVSDLKEISRAPDAVLADVELLGGGAALHWESLDADYGIPELVIDLFGTAAARAALSRAGGRVRSEAKSSAARENGKGGRPRKGKRQAATRR